MFNCHCSRYYSLIALALHSCNKHNSVYGAWLVLYVGNNKIQQWDLKPSHLFRNEHSCYYNAYILITSVKGAYNYFCNST